MRSYTIMFHRSSLLRCVAAICCSSRSRSHPAHGAAASCSTNRDVIHAPPHCSCVYIRCLSQGKCLHTMTKNDLKCMHNEVYGYGSGNTLHSLTEKMDIQRGLISSWARYDPDNGEFICFDYTIYGARNSRVCRAAAAAIYDISYNTLNTVEAIARKGQHELRSLCAERDVQTALDSAKRAASFTKKNECIEWWISIIQTWDEIPSERIIVHPHLIWSCLFDEYCAYMTPVRRCFALHPK